MELRRTDSANEDFLGLVRKLDAFLAEIDGEEHAFYAQFNKTQYLRQVVVVYEEGIAVGCGAIRPLEDGSMEVKRMYTEPAHRGKGIAAAVLNELETWASELGYVTCVLETGLQQDAAIRLYGRAGYGRIPNYGQYVGIENSVCFRKELPAR